MSKHQKFLDKLSAVPVPSGIKWDDLVSTLKHLGFELLKNSGSRRKFFHPETKALIICHQPHPSPDVDKGCIADVVETLKAYRFIIQE